MAGRVAGSRFEPDLVGYTMLIVDQSGHPFRHDGANRIVDRILEERVLGTGEEIPFGATDQVFCVGKSWDPFVALEHGVPTDVIDMQMSADNVVDRLARIANLLQVLQKRQL